MPRIVDHDAQREQLLDACFRLIADEGYAASSMRRLARAAGVSTGTLYHYFPDKRSILVGMFALVTARDAERVRNTLAPDASVEDRIRALYRFMRENQDGLRDRLRVAMEVHRHEPTAESRQDVADAMRGYRDAVADILGRDGILVSMAFAQLVGVMTQGMLDPDGVDLNAHEAFVLAAWAQLEDSLS